MQASELEKDYLNLYTSALPPAISQILDKAIFSSNSLQQVLDLILFMALQLTGAEYGSLRWMNHRTNKLIMKAVRHHSKQTLAIDDFPDLSLKVDSVLARIANTKKSLMIPDLSQENWPQVYHPLDPNVPMRSELAIPILSSDKQAVMGVLNVESTKAGVFTADHLSYLNTLAERAKIAVSRAQLFDAIRIIGSKVLEMDQNSLFTYIVEALAELVQVAVCSIWLLEERDGNLVLKNSVGRSPEDTEAFDIRLKTDSFIGQVVSTLQPVSTRDVHRETNFYKKEYKDWKSLLAVPIVDTEKKVLGVISLISVEERSFTQHDIDLVTAFCSYLAVAIGQAKLLQEKEYNLKVVSSLQTITSTLATSNHLDALLNSIVEQANSLLEATGSILYLRSESIESNKVAAAVGKATTALGMLTPLTGSLSGHVTLHNEPLLTDINDPRIDLRIAQQIGIKYVAAVPLQLEDRSIGALVVLDKHSGKLPFTEADLKLLKALADEAAVAIKKQRLYEQLERHTCQVQVVKDILADSLTAVDVAALLKKAALRISKTFNYRVDIGLTQAGRLVFKASVLYGFKPNGQVRDIPANQGITGAALQTGGSILISDVSQNGRYQAFSSETRSELAVPLRSPNGNCVGVLNLESTQLDDFSKQDVQVFEAIADGITLALENTLGRKRLVVLNRISAAALQAQDLDQVMDMIMKTVVDLFSAGACALYLTIPGLQRLFLSHHIELPPNVVERVQELDLGKSIAGRVLRSGKSIYVRDMTTDPRADGTVTEEDGLRSLVDVPIKIDKRILGVLAVLTKEVRTFDEYDMSILEAIGNSIGTIIENARLNQEYKQLYESVRDPILIIDLNGKIVNANPEASLVSGYKHEELLGKHVTDLMLDRKTKQKARQRLTQLADGIDVPIMEVEIGHKNGSAIFIESKPTIVRNNRGYVTYIIAIWRDITIRKQTDEMLYRQRAADKVLEQMGSIGARVIHRMVGFLSTWRMGIRELRGRIVSITSTDEELFDVLESSSHRAFHFVDQFQRIRETVNQQKEIVTFAT